MSSKNQAEGEHKPSKRKQKPALVSEQARIVNLYSDLPAALTGATGDLSEQGQADYLRNPRFSIHQQQMAATQIGKVGGNRHLQRVLAQANKTGKYKPQAASASRIMRQDHDTSAPGAPTAAQAAQRTLQGAVRILGIPNFIYTSVDHTNAVQGFVPPAAQRYMLFEFWLAVSSHEVATAPSTGTYRRATPAERLNRLTHANETANTVFGQLGPAPWPGAAGEAVRAYQSAYQDARGRVMDETVSAELEAQPTPNVYEAPEIELEQQRLAVSNSLAALTKFSLLISRLSVSTTARFGNEIRAALTQIAAQNPRLAGVGSMPIPEAILHTRGVLNGINAILTISDPQRRNQLLMTELSVRHVADVTRVLLGLIEGLVATTCLIGSSVARLVGNTGLASNMFRMGASNIVRRIGWIAALAQTVHGISVLMDSGSTESERLQGVLDVAMGSAGLTGAAASLGVESLAGLAGPLSVGILVTAGEVAFLRSAIRGMEQGMATGGITQSLNIVEYEAGGVAHSANELAQAMQYASQRSSGTPAIGQPGELSAAANREVQFKTRRLRESLQRAINRVTQRQGSLAILFQPASWEHVWRPFEALRTRLQQATTPEALLAVASAYIEAARDLFRNIARTIARTLRDVDRSRSGGILPHILGGLHDDQRGQSLDTLTTQ